MIGQKKIREFIDTLIENDKVPSFIIFVGARGSGRTMLSKYIANRLSAHLVPTGIKVDDIREAIDMSYKVKDDTIYCIKNADTMRNEAKNAMLKITEEPPKNAKFILTVEDDSTLLDTIKSRGMVFKLEPYSRQDIIDYATLTSQACIPYCDVATTPYELDVLNSYGKDFLEYVELVVDNIGEVEPSNAFKSASKLAIKDDNGYDLKLFWECFIYVCNKRILDDPLHYADGICKTMPPLVKVSKSGVNKQHLYDSWVFEIRGVWV